MIQYYHILFPHFYVGSRFQTSHPLARQSLSSRLTLVVFISSPSLRIHLHFLPLPAYPSSFPPPPCVSIFISSPSLRIHHHHCFTHIPLFSPPPPCVSITIIVSPTYHSSLLPLPAYPSPSLFHPHITLLSSPSLRIHHHHCFTHISLFSPPPPYVSITIIVSPTYHSSLLPIPAYPSPSLFHPHITLLIMCLNHFSPTFTDIPSTFAIL